MSIDLAEWLQDVQSRRRSTIREPVSVAGKLDRHLGPRWDFAEIAVLAEPANEWKLEVELAEKD